VKDPKWFLEVMEFLTESHLDTDGGYPYDWTQIDDTVVIATLDDGKEGNAAPSTTYRFG